MLQNIFNFIINEIWQWCSGVVDVCTVSRERQSYQYLSFLLLDITTSFRESLSKMALLSANILTWLFANLCLSVYQIPIKSGCSFPHHSGHVAFYCPFIAFSDFPRIRSQNSLLFFIFKSFNNVLQYQNTVSNTIHFRNSFRNCHVCP